MCQSLREQAGKSSNQENPITYKSEIHCTFQFQQLSPFRMELF